MMQKWACLFSCPVATGSQGPLSLKRSFETETAYAESTTRPDWCLTSGPIKAGKWVNKPGGANPTDKLHFQCVVGFCTIENSTDLCHDVSCAPLIFKSLLHQNL